MVQFLGSIIAINEKIKQTDALGNVTQWSYDANGNMTSTTDALGNVISYTYNALNELTQTTYADGTTSKTTYDANGNKLTFTDQNNNTTSWVYDTMNRVVQETDPTGAKNTTQYNAAGEVTLYTDRNGNTKTYTYDAAGHETQEVWKNSTGTVLDTLSYTYNLDGTLKTASNNAGSYSFTWDNLGRLASETDPNSLTLTYTYDAVNNILNIADNQGGLITSTYDANHNLLTRSQSGTNAVAMSVSYTYDADNRVTQIQRYSDATQTNLISTTAYGYDPIGDITSEMVYNHLSQLIISYANTYDGDQRITSENRNNVVTNFSYNKTSEVTAAGSQSLSYDAAGNQNSAGFVIGTDNRITSDGTWNYTYDSSGNVISKVNISTGETWTFTYNLHHQMLSATDKTSSGVLISSETFVYDVFGNQISMTLTNSSGSTTTLHSYDISGATMGIDAHVNPLWADLSSTDTITTRYFTGDTPGSNNTNSLLARSQVNGGSTATAWLGTDRQGSVRDILDPTSGNLQDSLTYSAFGAITSQSNASWTGSITYTGLIFDANSGMLFAKYRALNPATGQWLSEDPLGLTAGDPNVRRYAGNNTENAQDGSGLRENNAQDYERKKLHWFGNDLWYYSRGGNWYYVGSKLVYKGITYNDRIERTVPTSNGPTQYWAPFGDILAESQDTYTTGDWDRFFRRYGQPVGQMTVGPRHDYVSTEENVSNAVAGFGDTVTMGGTQQIRQLVGIDDIINYGSEEYIGGAIVGTGVNGALGNGWGVAYGASTIAGSYGNWGLQNPNSPNNIMGDTGNHLLSLVGKTGQAVSGVRGWGGWLGKASKSGYGWVAIPGIGIPTWNAGKGLYNATGNWGQLSGWDRAELLIPLAAGIGTGVRYGRSDYVNARGPGLFRVDSDLLYPRLGPARLSHPREYLQIMKELEEAGVKIELRKGSLAYSPEKGGAGKMILDPDVSISALRHEYQHFLDIRAAEFPGLGAYYINLSEFARVEIRGYMREIATAKQTGNRDLIPKIVEQMKARVKEVLGR